MYLNLYALYAKEVVIKRRGGLVKNNRKVEKTTERNTDGLTI